MMTKMQKFTYLRGTSTGVLRVKRLTNGAVLPRYGSERAAGLDLSADLTNMRDVTDTLFFGTREEVILVIPPGGRQLIKTGLVIDLPCGTYGRVAPRSGLALKHGIDVLAGVVDEDYKTGEVGVILQNLGDRNVTINHGDRIAQLIVERYLPVLVEEVDDTGVSARGAAGFGSTGV